jgi:hypothetical protein
VALAHLDLLQDDPTAASVEAQMAAVVSQRHLLPGEEVRARAMLARAFTQLGDWVEAAGILEEAEVLVESSEELTLRYELALARAKLAAAEGDRAVSQAQFEDLRQRAKDSAHLIYSLQAELALAKLLHAAGDPGANPVMEHLLQASEERNLDYFTRRVEAIGAGG